MRFALRGAWRDLLAPTMLLALVFGVFVWRAKHGMRFTTFGDESMHFVGAKVLLSGGILYRDFIEVHGPVAYAIPQLFGAVFGWQEPLHARIIMVLLTIGAAACIARSACLEGGWERLAAPAIFLGLTTTLWLVQGLCLYDYQPVAGAMLVSALALAVVPAWCGGTARPFALLMSGVALGTVPFVAFSYGPAAALFFASAAFVMVVRRAYRPLGDLVAGAVLGILAVLGWMLRYADFRGYLVFHIIHAVVDFGPYLHFGLVPALQILLLPPTPGNLGQIIGVVAAASGLIALAACGALRRGSRISFLLGVAGVIACNSRGSPGFQNGAFILVSFGAAALGLARLPRCLPGRDSRPMRLAWISAFAMVIAGAELTARQARSSPHGYFRANLRDLPKADLAQSEASWATKLRTVTDPGEPVLAVPYWPDLYLLAGRPPMWRYVYYLPWDADYARRPWLGVKHDLCADIARQPPPVIYDNNWVVWNRYDPQHYMACLTGLLNTLYTPMPGERFLYVRNDRIGRLRF